ncbi:MAG TPA: PAS domain-containing protein [Stellaceae bacterium]
MVTVPLVCGYFVSSLYRSEVAAIHSRLEIPAHALAHSTGAITHNADAALRNIQAALRDTGDGQLAAAAARQIEHYHDGVSVAISRVAIYDVAGEPLARGPGEPPGKGSVPDYDFFRRQAAATGDAMLVSDLVPDPVDGAPMIILSRRIVDRAGKLRGVAAVYIGAASIESLFDALQMPVGSTITAFNRDGRMLMRTPTIHLGDPETKFDFARGPVFPAFRDGPSTGSFAKFKTYSGVDRFVAGVGGHDAPIIVAAGWDVSKALAPWRRTSEAIIGGTAAVLALVLAMLIHLRGQIRRNDALLAQVSEAEQRQRDLITALPDAVAIINDRLAIEFANPAAERLYGYGAGEMSGIVITDVMASPAKDADRESARLYLQRDGQSASTRVLQRSAKRKDGSEFPVEISTCRYDAAEGSKLISVIRDVTMRQTNDLALHRGRKNLARAQKMAALGSFERDLQTGFFECSDEFLHIWGLPPGTEASLAMLVERVHPQDRESFVATRVAVLSGKAMPKSEFRIIRPDGEERILYHEYSADFGPDGRPMRSFGIVQDITERKLAEIVLRSSQENLARAQRIAAIGSFDRDLITGRTEWSEEFVRIWGITAMPEGDTADFLLARVHPDDHERFKEGHAAAINDQPLLAPDFRIVRPDGTIRILHRDYGVIHDGNGRAVRLFGTVQDVTERREIENELRRSREDLARAQEVASIGSFSRDIATGKTEWSDEFLRIWGIEGAMRPVAESLAQMVHPADRKAFLQGRDAALHQKSGMSLDFRVMRPDGEERILHREYGVVFDDAGKATRMFGTVQDITERRRAEIELRRSRENMARAQQLACIGSFERDLVTGTIEWSEEMFRILGLDPAAPRPGEAYLNNLVHPDDFERFENARRDELAGTTIGPIEYRVIRVDGVERIMRRESAVTFDADKRPIRLFGTLQDITERKRAELQIIESHENLMRAQRIANMGSFDHDLVTGRVEWSDQMYRINGLDPEKIPPSSDVVLDLVHPEDREGFAAARVRSRRANFDAFEFRIIRPDGEERFVRRESDVHFGEDGRPLRVFGTLQDITERKRAELEIIQSRESMAHAQRIANMGSFDHELTADRTTWSDQMFTILGVDTDSVPPGWATTLQFVHPEDRDGFVATRARADAAHSEPFEFRITRADGEERILRREYDVHSSDDGRPLRIFGTMQDITEQRLAQARERNLERQLLHSQKLEALGTLAGGIAHDLNNTLVPIMALSKLTARRFEAGTPVRANLDTIYEASERARDLVRRVLAFSRKEEPERQEANLAEVVREALKLMRATVPTSIQLDAAIADVPPIRADASQIHQVITNLISNAAGAITNGMGTITVSLGLTVPATGPSEVCLSVADTGCGMDEATQERIFEPFFTTKTVGEGTGLGLSIVHGIIASHGGRIELKSAPGKGTRFDLYFPLPKAAADEAAAASEAEAEVRSSRPAA